MRLADSKIKALLKSGDLTILPHPKDGQITGVTVDVHLGDSFKLWTNYLKDVDGVSMSIVYPANGVAFSAFATEPLKDFLEKSENNWRPEEVGNGLVIAPGSFCLGVTEESIKIPDYLVGWLDGRSSLARLGLQVHVTAHRIDPGWDGKVVLEFYNCGPFPILLTPGMKIGALSFEAIDGVVETPYLKREDATYKNQQGVVNSGG